MNRIDHIRIIRRAFEIVRRYPVLWIFGFLLALTTGRPTGPENNVQWTLNDGPGGDFSLPEGFPRLPFPVIPQDIANALVVAGIALACLALLLVVAFTILHYVALAASIRMVDRYEASGEQLGFRAGWRLGWSRAAFRLWLIDLLVFIGVLLAVILLFLLAAAPLLLLLTQNDVASVVGVVATIGLVFLVILVIILVGAVLGILLQFVHRAVTLEDLGVFEGFRRGWALVRRRPGDMIIMALILFGIGLVFAILLIPVALVLLVFGVIVGGLPALLAGALTNIFVHGNVPQLVAIAVGLPIFILAVSIPLAFVSGLLEMFTSSAWTLTYREVLAVENVQPETA
jgi:hypothetical protein